MQSTSSLQKIAFLTAVVVGLLSYNFLSAQWIGPTAIAPSNNAVTPINVGSDYQPKSDDLGAFRMRAGLYCDASGLNCYTIAALAGGGGGGITQLTGGAGITLAPSTITSTGTVSINSAYTQRRVASTCPVGQSIRQINADGTVVCQDVTPTCQLEGISFASGYRCRVSQGSCGGIGTRYNYLNCGSDGSWSDQSSCTSLTPPVTPSCP